MPPEACVWHWQSVTSGDVGHGTAHAKDGIDLVLVANVVDLARALLLLAQKTVNQVSHLDLQGMSLIIRQLLHHVAELIKLDHSVVVVIDLFEELAQCFVKLIFYSQGLLQFILRNSSASILVK